MFAKILGNVNDLYKHMDHTTSVHQDSLEGKLRKGALRSIERVTGFINTMVDKWEQLTQTLSQEGIRTPYEQGLSLHSVSKAMSISIVLIDVHYRGQLKE